MIEDFQQPDIFHMGGDEVNIDCWRSINIITNWMLNKGWDLSNSSFYLLWNYFQERALEKLKIANGGKDIPAILWTSGLTNDENLQYIDPKKYIIQIWTTGYDATIRRLLRNDFKVIFSNYDALYLDCGWGELMNYNGAYYFMRFFCKKLKSLKTFDRLHDLKNL